MTVHDLRAHCSALVSELCELEDRLRQIGWGSSFDEDYKIEREPRLSPEAFTELQRRVRALGELVEKLPV
jgi:hypothetical protein